MDWDTILQDLKKKVVLDDCEQWQNNKDVQYIAGADISYVKGDIEKACICLLVLDRLNEWNVVYEDMQEVNMKHPYTPGYLAFREAPFILDLIEKLRNSGNAFFPQCLFIDGNGFFHPLRCGLACYIGVLADIPCIGVSKTLIQFDGIENDNEHKSKIAKLSNFGDNFEILSKHTSEVLGVCFRSLSKNPIYISIGHKISLETCIWLVKDACKYRIPEPIRQADIRSRQFLREGATNTVD